MATTASRKATNTRASIGRQYAGRRAVAGRVPGRPSRSDLGCGPGAEREPVRPRPDLDRVALPDLAVQQAHREGVLDLALDEPLQWPRPVCRVVSRVREVF